MTISVSATTNVTLEHVTSWQRELKSDIALLRQVIGDKNRSLDERWEIYILIQPYLETDGSYMNFDTLGEVSWYDDFYIEKGETQQLDEDFIKSAAKKFKMDFVQQNALKEEILEVASKEGYGSFENDW